jgi:hypothetical protein
MSITLDSPPLHLTDPLTAEMWVNAVIGNDGHTYSRPWILRALAIKSESPVTRQRMTVADLTPHRMLRNEVEEWQRANGQTSPSPPPSATTVATAPKPQATTVSLTTDGTVVAIHAEGGSGPSHKIFILDTSGSMKEEAAAGTKGSERTGRSIGEIAQHGICTAIEGTPPTTLISFITFNTNARVVQSKVLATVDGKAVLQQSVKGVVFGGMTNFWSAVHTAYEQLSGTDGVITIFTDGQPTIVPPRGHEAMLTKLINEKERTYPINVVGFGYALEAPLIDLFVRRTGGSNIFVPDVTFIGTGICHSEAHNDHVVGTNASILNEDGTTVDVGLLLAGQSTVSLVGESRPVSMCYIPMGATEATTLAFAAADTVPCAAPADVVAATHLASVLRRWTLHEFDSGEFDAFRQDVAEFPRIVSWLDDQCAKAFEKPEWFEKWGRDYILAMARSLETQRCISFKEPLLQYMVGPDVERSLDRYDAIFNKMAMPQPSIPTSVPAWTGLQLTRSATTGGCFAPNSLVKMGDGSTKTVASVKPGDLLSSGGVVKRIVRTQWGIDDTLYAVSSNSSGAFTPYHPVLVGGRWAFPIDVGEPTDVHPTMVYNFLLCENSKQHVATIDGVQAVLLAHGIQEDAAAHPYFATNRVRYDVEKAPATSGVVDASPGWFQRDKSGRVCGFSAFF